MKINKECKQFKV